MAPDLDALPDDDPLSALEREFAQPPFGDSGSIPRLDYLDSLEGRPADALKGLQSYDFKSPEAEAKFNELVDKLRQQMMQQYFKGAEQALQNMTPEDMQRMKNMMLRPERDGAQAQQRRAVRLRELHAAVRRLLPGEPAEPRRAARVARATDRAGAGDDELDVAGHARSGSRTSWVR